MARKATKAAAILELLNQGISTGKIVKRLKVAPSYVWKLKKEMAHKTDDDNEVRPRTVTPHKVMRVTKAEAEAFRETAYQITRGRQARQVDAVLDERHDNYGSFYDLAALAQNFKNVMMSHLRQHDKHLIVDQQEALEFILTKIARILNGNADNVDSWVDIAGYAKLVADRLQGNVR